MSSQCAETQPGGRRVQTSEVRLTRDSGGRAGSRAARSRESWSQRRPASPTVRRIARSRRAMRRSRRMVGRRRRRGGGRRARRRAPSGLGDLGSRRAGGARCARAPPGAGRGGGSHRPREQQRVQGGARLVGADRAEGDLVGVGVGAEPGEEPRERPAVGLLCGGRVGERGHEPGEQRRERRDELTGNRGACGRPVGGGSRAWSTSGGFVTALMRRGARRCARASAERLAGAAGSWRRERRPGVRRRAARRA